MGYRVAMGDADGPRGVGIRGILPLPTEACAVQKDEARLEDIPLLRLGGQTCNHLGHPSSV